MSSELRVDKIVPVNGVPTGGGGGVIQTIMGSTTTQVETTSKTFSDSTLTATITPTRSDSKILITVAQLLRTHCTNSSVDSCLLYTSPSPRDVP